MGELQALPLPLTLTPTPTPTLTSHPSPNPNPNPNPHQAPVGYDQNSYAYRDRLANAATDTPGCRFHESTGVDYGGSYGPGDVIGCWLRMGPGTASVRSRQRINIKGVEYIVEEERERTPSPIPTPTPTPTPTPNPYPYPYPYP